ncbi:MAG TPA: SUMF1/EgtB/PvdO family nonheme iron enzyme, partial [Solirubrobacteraceae bacterium]
MDGFQAAVASSDAQRAVDDLQESRERTLELVAPFSDEELERVHSTLMSPLVWDLGHIAAFEDLWLAHRHGGLPLLRDDLADVYDAFETPRAGRGDLPFLRPGPARDYLREVRERVLDVIAAHGVGDGVIAELIVRHEQQHNETMLQTVQLAQLEGLPLGEPAAGASPTGNGARAGMAGLTGLEMVEIPGGECTIGTSSSGFAYDNERPRHRTDVRGYLIGRTPITNATYLTFVEGGGYERREWWSDEGWSWKEDYDITRPQSWTPDL